MRLPLPLGERIARHIEIAPSDCWEWTGARFNTGYGAIRVNGKTTTAHRVSYEAFVGAIPAGLAIDHLCRNRACVNPVHLEAVSQRENNQRASVALGNRCRRGHDMSDAQNVYVRRTGTRQCAVCMHAANKRWRLRNPRGQSAGS